MTRAMLAVAALATLLGACAATPPTVGPTTAPTPTPEVLLGELTFDEGAARQVPADGTSAARLRASVSNASGAVVAHRQVELRTISGVSALAGPARTATGFDGVAEFAVTSTDAGSATVGLYVVGGAADALATIDLNFTRKVVVLAPGFQSALVRRFEIFGEPSECIDPARPGSITEALICLGYLANAAADPAVGAATAGATILDMSWEATPCRPNDPPEAADCVATISPAAAGDDVLWQPADYDLAELALSLARQSSVDEWARRLLRTLAVYDEELFAATATHASFYLVGHSLGGEVVVRSLRALLDDQALAAGFEGDNRGRLPVVMSIDGALNWTGGFAFFGDGPRCGLPVYTTPDDEREMDNVDAVEQAFDRFGVVTVATTAETDPIVGPAVALLNSPARPARGYVEAVFSSGAECSHASLLRPEPAPSITFPLNDLLVEHVGPAGGR